MPTVFVRSATNPHSKLTTMLVEHSTNAPVSILVSTLSAVNEHCSSNMCNLHQQQQQTPDHSHTLKSVVAPSRGKDQQIHQSSLCGQLH